MSKFFYVADKKSQKFIIKANIDNKLFADNSTIAHVCISRNKFRVYIHERADAVLNDTRAVHNPSYDKLKNEKFSSKFDYPIARKEKATPKQREAEDKKALNELLASFEALAKTSYERLTTEAEANTEAEAKA